MPRRPDDYMAQRRHDILQAMEHCIRRDGWERATMDEVAREAGLSKGAVYVHFKGKRDLLVGLLERDAASIEHVVGIADAATLRADLIGALAHFAGPDGWRVAAGTIEARIEGVRDPELREQLGRGSDRMIDLLTGAALRLNPRLSDQDARARAIALFALVNGMTMLESFGATMAERDIEAVIDLHLQWIVAPEDTSG